MHDLLNHHVEFTMFKYTVGILEHRTGIHFSRRLSYLALSFLLLRTYLRTWNPRFRYASVKQEPGEANMRKRRFL